MKSKILAVFACVVMITMTGCVGQEAFTKMARRGDTVTLSLGGSPRHEINDHVDKDNMQVKITDSAGTTHDVNLRYLFKLYSDPTNRYNYNATYDTEASNWFSRRFIDPHQGLWVAVVDLTYPGTSTPLPLAEGMANFQVITPDLVNSRQTYFPAVPITDGYLSQIPIEILPDTGTPPVPGSPHLFNNYGDPIEMEPLPQVLISFDNTALSLPYPDERIKIGAIEFKLAYDKAYFDDVEFPPMVLGNINEPRINVLVGNDSAIGEYTVVVLAPFAGVLANDDPDNVYLKPKLKDMKIFVFWDPSFISTPIDATNFDQVFTISGYKVVDKNGVSLEDGLGSPLVTLEKDLLMN